MKFLQMCEVRLLTFAAEFVVHPNRHEHADCLAVGDHVHQVHGSPAESGE